MTVDLQFIKSSEEPALGQMPLYAEAVPEGALLVVPASYAAEKGLKDVRAKS